MTWTGRTFNVGDILTAAQMNQLQADITAVCNADSGAPLLWPRALQPNSYFVGSQSLATGGTSTYVTPGIVNVFMQAGNDTSMTLQQYLAGAWRDVKEVPLNGENFQTIFCNSYGFRIVVSGGVGSNAELRYEWF